MKTWKIQKFFADIVYDLRSRGLLPIAALLLIAMVAVPVLIVRPGSGSGAASGHPAASAAELAPENQAAVLAYNPGVRNYKKRLGELSEKDPFVQQFTAPEVGATSLEQSGLGTAPQPSSDGSSTGSGTTTRTGRRTLRYFYLVTDLKVGEAGTELKRRNSVDPFDYLPTESLPVAVFLGNQSKDDAVFLISTDVLSTDGAGKCFPSQDACQLLTLKIGESAELVYGPDSKTYRIKVVRVKLKVSRKPPKR